MTQKKHLTKYLGHGAVCVTALLIAACGPSAPPTPAEAPPPIATTEAAPPVSAAPSVTAAAPSSAPALAAAKAPSAKPASTTAAATPAAAAPPAGNGLPPPYDVADLANGKRVFNQCSACHKTAAGAGHGLGPNLHGVFGTKAGEIPGFAFSEPLKASGITWDYASMDKWLAGPAAMVPGNRMTFIGVRNADDRRDVIAFLKTETSQ